MADKIQSVDFLPEVFQTETNKQFLKSTLDQLIQEPKVKRIEGYVGRITGPNVKSSDTYIREGSLDRANYQLEPSIIFKKDNKKVDALTYPGLVDGLKTKGGITFNHDRMFSSETYSWDTMFDLDKFINYNQYYWLPNGPDSVGISASTVFLSNTFNFTRDSANDDYKVGTFEGGNPIITLVRGGSYTFNVSQNGNPFFLQVEPGTDGILPWTHNRSSREILGVQNNGDDSGNIIFNVPEKTDQDFYFTLNDIGDVDIATDLRFDEVQYRLLSELNSIDDTLDLDGKTIVFLNNESEGWKYDASLLSGTYSPALPTNITFLNQSERYNVYKINVVYDVNGDNAFYNLTQVNVVNVNDTFTIQYGNKYSNWSFYKTFNGHFETVPIITATKDRLYYQDATNPDMFGIINILDQNEEEVLYINDIIGKKEYISPNGIKFSNGLKVKIQGRALPSSYENNEYYIEGVGESIAFLPVENFITPETYTLGENDNPNSPLFNNNAPVKLDYLTINRASNDLNGWTRSNRWFHIDVIEYASSINNSSLVLDNTVRANRPIIEFEPNLKLFNYGTYAKKFVNIIDFDTVDAFSTINGINAFAIDGYVLEDGSRVIFAADTDETVRNKIYEVNFVDTNNDGNNIIILSETSDTNIGTNNVILVKNGITQGGKVFSLTNDNILKESQPKTSVNQAPLFDIYDNNNFSFSNKEIYTSTNFKGTKLFSYKVGVGTPDTVLGFPLSFLNIGNLGDIVFENNLYSDEYIFVKDSVSITHEIKDGFVRKYTSKDDFETKIGWIKSAEEIRQHQIFNFTYSGDPLLLDIYPIENLNVPAIKIFVDNIFVPPSNYSISIIQEGTLITFNTFYNTGSNIEIKIISDLTSEVGYYEIPSNLSSNAFNENSKIMTLGIIRNHFNNLAQNLVNIEGSINGPNNIRDLGKITPFGNIIAQQSSPLTLVSQFNRKNEYNFYDSLKFASQSYEKYKFKILTWMVNNEIQDLSVKDILDRSIREISSGLTSNNAFYQSDMMPNGNDYTSTTYNVTAISTNTFNTLTIYDFSKANNKGILVYKNDVLMTKDTDYEISSDSPHVVFLINLEIGDKIVINEYNSTLGSFLPSTPTKLGLYPKFKPEIFLDDTYITPIKVIRGHDGSIQPAFDDIRDDVLLEFELRIYNNIKVNSDIPLEINSIFPGQFRETEYTDAEITEILSQDLLRWLGWNRIEYSHQDYRANEELTWNYGKSSNILDGNLLKGNWRGIYNYFYDTDAPHLRPWEMLGFSEEPKWWFQRYGSAPYTSGNAVLWDDLEIGLIKDPANEYIDKRFIREGLSKVIPVSSEGKLLSPLQVMVANYSSYDFQSDWKIGDQSPAESAFRKSSAWPFAVQRILSLMKPAKYFALMADRDQYTYNKSLDQYVLNGRHRLDSRHLELGYNGVLKHSYINWIIDYNIHYGYESIIQLTDELKTMDINLCYRMGSFTDKKTLKIFTNNASPENKSGSLLLPDESYDLLLYKNQPFDEVSYSAVMIKQVENGYVVTGNSATDPYFKINLSILSANYKTITVGRTTQDATTFRYPLDFSSNVVYVPYGFVFSNKHAVIDFIAGYESYLKKQGMRFANIENNKEISWQTMAETFIFWSNQGWENESVINLNPGADGIEFERPLSIVDSLLDLPNTDKPLDQNRLVLDDKDFVINRQDNNFKITILNNKALGYLKFKLTNFEHLLILDNVSIFNDLIYDPISGIRQSRVKLVGTIVGNWNGQLNAPGFMLNQDNIKLWSKSSSYNKGNIVKFKNDYWVANGKIQPSEEFNFNEWFKIDYKDITKGLLSNLATKSNSMLSFYDVNKVNLESDADLLSLGLTGFRPRTYLSDLDLDDISQVNIYQDLIQNKGTPNSLDLFNKVTVNGEPINYEIYENWAIQRATYGASSSRTYVEFQLEQQFHNSNPSLVEIVLDTNQDTKKYQTISLDKFYKQSEKHNNINIFPIINEKRTDVNLPYAGFVNRDDVNITTFSLDSFDDINQQLDDIIDGVLIWVAKDTLYDWNVYRTTAIKPELITVVDHLDGTITFKFNAQHNLKVGENIIIKYFDNQVNGTYKIGNIDSLTSVRVLGSLSGETTQLSDKGICLVLKSARVIAPSNISGTLYDNQLFLEDKIWVKNDNGKSSVYEKNLPYKFNNNLQSININNNSSYGSAIAQGADNYGAVITDPDNNTIYCYVDKGTGEFVLNNSITLDNVSSLGNDVSMAKEWIVVGAKDDSSYGGTAVIIKRDKIRNEFLVWQYLNLDANVFPSKYAETVVISDNEKWIAIGEPKNNKVHLYNKVEYIDQTATFIGTGYTSIFDISDSIKVQNNNKSQITVFIDGVKVQSSDYVLDVLKVVFINPPSLGSVIKVTRNNNESQGGTGVNTYTINTLYTANNDNITVLVNGKIQHNYYDYTVIGNTVTFTSSIPAGTTIEFRTETYFKYIDTISSNDSQAGDNFGKNIDIAHDGSQIIIGAPNATVQGKLNAGKVYVFNRTIERFIVTDANQTLYITQSQSPHPLTQEVRVNNKELNSGVQTVKQEFVVSGNNLTLNYPEIAVGDFLEIDINEFKSIQTITQDNPIENAQFGSSLSICNTKCSLYVGADHDSRNKLEAGTVSRIINKSRIISVIVGQNSNPVLTINDTIQINRVNVEITSPNLDQLITNINNSNIPNVSGSNQNGKLVIELINKNVISPANMLEVLPGQGSAFEDLGLSPYILDQIISAPNETEHSNFGNDLQIDENNNHLIVSAVNGTVDKLTSMDKRKTTFDGKSMRIIDSYVSSGIVYSFDLLKDSEYYSPGKLIFGQQIYDNDVDTFAKFGHKVNIANGNLMVSSLNYNKPVHSAGRIAIFTTDTDSNHSWNLLRNEKDSVDVRLINSVMLYDKNTQDVLQYLDYIDPLNGKILGVAKSNIDYISVTDPASYGKSSGVLWGKKQVNEIWWDIEDTRYVNYNLNDPEESNKLWGKLFPGSKVKVYQWIESDVPPFSYTGEGTIYNPDKFITVGKVDTNNIVINSYYYWVRGIKTISTSKDKTLSANTIASYIANPEASGIPYASFIAQNIVGLTNAKNIINENTILHIEYDKIKQDDKVFKEFDLIREGRSDDFLSDTLYKKLQDSFCGSDSLGNLVPDIKLSIANQFGISFRPRQSMFKNKFLALESYLSRVNNLLKIHPISEAKVYPLLKSEEPIPLANSGEWNFQVNTSEELTYFDLTLTSNGDKILVLNDFENSGLWAIYEVYDFNKLKLVNVQSYDTKLYWSFIDWYANGVDNNTKIDVVINTASELQTIHGIDKAGIIKVLSNSDNKWELYKYSNGWERVGLESGTIHFSETLYDYGLGRFGYDVEVYGGQYYDQEPITELRFIIRSINEEILTGDLAIERNNLLISVFNYILSEQDNVDWLYKTSLIDVNHKVRSLIPNSSYITDNQSAVIDYIEEVKPYHTKLKEFLLSYSGFETMEGLITDFDCPSFYDINSEQFISPVLDDGANLVTNPSNTPASSKIWKSSPYSEWFNNFTLSIDSVKISHLGSGYTEVPEITINGNTNDPAKLIGRINSNGELTNIDVIHNGSGYRSTPVIEITGGNGSGAQAVPIINHGVVRSFSTTIKYDRYEYETQILTWEDQEEFNVGDLIRYNNKVYQVLEANTDTTFLPSKYKEYPIDGTPGWENDNTLAKPLSGIDRTMGFYVANVNNPGLDIALLIKGISYPGVKVKGTDFSATLGFDPSSCSLDTNGIENPYDCSSPVPFDSSPFDIQDSNTSELDTIYESKYPGPNPLDPSPTVPYSIEDYSNTLDTYSGVRSTDIDVDGGDFIDTYHSHAPEELVPGSVFDTLDITVRSRPGSDILTDGHGFLLNSRVFEIHNVVNNPSISFKDISKFPISLKVFNNTSNTSLYENINYTTNWSDQTITILNGVSDNDEVKVYVGSIGGGDELLRDLIKGSNIVNNEYKIPVIFSEILDIIIFANGIKIRNVTFEDNGDLTTKIVFSDSFTASTNITITVLGNSVSYRENYYKTHTFVAGGVVPTLFNAAYFNDPNAIFNGTTSSLTEFIMPTGTMGNIDTQMNAIVEVNGLRLRPPAGNTHIGDGVATKYISPVSINSSGEISNVQDNEIIVIVNDVKQTLNLDYSLTPQPGPFAIFNVSEFNNANFYDQNDNISRAVVFHNAPPEKSRIEIYVTTDSEYHFVGDQLIFNALTIVQNDVISVTTYNDTTELRLLTETFVGPSEFDSNDTRFYSTSPYDTEVYDESVENPKMRNIWKVRSLRKLITERSVVSWDISSWDETDWDEDHNREFIDLPIPPVDQDRLWVTLNGNRLNPGEDFEIFDGNVLKIFGDPLDSTDVVAITSMTDSVVENGIAFRLFKDMRGNTAMYSMSKSVETQLTQNVSPLDDIIHVSDASKLGQPDLPGGRFGIAIINGERITYRNRDITNNTISGIRRGTAGTGANSHSIGELIQNAGLESLVPWRYDKVWYAMGDYQTDPYMFDTFGNNIGYADEPLYSSSAPTKRYEPLTLSEYTLGSPPGTSSSEIHDNWEKQVLESELVINDKWISPPVPGEDRPRLHRWNGTEWEDIGFVDDYNQNGSGFGTKPYDLSTAPSNGIPLHLQKTLPVEFIRG